MTAARRGGESYIVLSYIVMSYIVESYIVCGVVSDVTARSPSSVVSQGIRSAAGQVTAGVMGRVTRHATPHITPQVAVAVVPPVICETPCPVVPHVMTGVFSPAINNSIQDCRLAGPRLTADDASSS